MDPGTNRRTGLYYMSAGKTGMLEPSRSRIAREGWGSRINFQVSCGLKPHKDDDWQLGNKILDRLIEEDSNASRASYYECYEGEENSKVSRASYYECYEGEEDSKASRASYYECYEGEEDKQSSQAVQNQWLLRDEQESSIGDDSSPLRYVHESRSDADTEYEQQTEVETEFGYRNDQDSTTGQGFEDEGHFANEPEAEDEVSFGVMEEFEGQDDYDDEPDYDYYDDDY